MKYDCIIGNIVADLLPRCYQAILCGYFRPIFLVYLSFSIKNQKNLFYLTRVYLIFQISTLNVYQKGVIGKAKAITALELKWCISN